MLEFYENAIGTIQFLCQFLLPGFIFHSVYCFIGVLPKVDEKKKPLRLACAGVIIGSFGQVLYSLLVTHIGFNSLQSSLSVTGNVEITILPMFISLSLAAVLGVVCGYIRHSRRIEARFEALFGLTLSNSVLEDMWRMSRKSSRTVQITCELKSESLLVRGSLSQIFPYFEEPKLELVFYELVTLPSKEIIATGTSDNQFYIVPWKDITNIEYEYY